MPTESPELQAKKEEVRKNPGNAYAHAGLGYSYGELGQYQNAIVSYKEAIRINPDSAQFHNGLGWNYQKSGQHQNAIASFKEAIRTNPDGNSKTKSTGFWNY